MVTAGEYGVGLFGFNRTCLPERDFEGETFTFFAWDGIESAVNNALAKGTAIASVPASKKTAVETAMQKTLDGLFGQ